MSILITLDNNFTHLSASKETGRHCHRHNKNLTEIIGDDMGIR